MSKPEKWYRMPSGRRNTKDIDEWRQAWDRIIQGVESYFPDYQVSGFDPGVLLVARKDNKFTSFTLHWPQIMSLLRLNENGFPLTAMD